jgi:epoxyqueuosine reductase
VVRGAAALVVGARSYLLAFEDPGDGSDEHSGQAPPGSPTARIARYAWVDHYAELRAALGQVAGRLRSDGWKAVVLADDNSLVDRAAAARAGLGWYGKNANLLLPGRGSWFVLGSVVTDAPLVAASAPVADGCGPCRRCLDGCPTGAIVSPGVVDARRCLAWLLQAPGVFPREYRIALGDRIYGCDDCQEVCPENRRHGRPRPHEGPRVVRSAAGVLWLLTASDADVLARHGRWYLHDRDVDQVRRNALVVLGNVGDPSDRAVVDVLRRFLAHPRALLRAHAVWAAARLGLQELLASVAGDDDPLVRDELAALGVVP